MGKLIMSVTMIKQGTTAPASRGVASKEMADNAGDPKMAQGLLVINQQEAVKSRMNLN